MRILIAGAGGVGTSAALIAARRTFYESVVVADHDLARAEAVVARVDDPRFTAARLDAADAGDVTRLCFEHGITHLLNVVDPRFVPTLFDGAFAAGANYLDTAMSVSRPHPTEPFSRTGVTLGAYQFERAGQWQDAGLLALTGIGVEPGLADIFARYAADHLFSEIDEVGIRDGANLVVHDHDFAPSFSIWTVIEECLNPPVVWERDRGWYTLEPFSEPEVFDFPDGIGPVECVHVEHEEVMLVPRWIDCRKVTFKYGLGQDFIDVLRTIHRLGLDRTDKVKVGEVEVSPRDVIAALLPDPATLGDHMSGKTCAGTWITGTDTLGRPLQVYLYHVADNAWTMAEYGVQAVVWQTAMNPVIALELLARGEWSGAGVLGPEAFDAVPFLELLRSGYGQQWHIEDRTPAPPAQHLRSARLAG
jgi:saccharopine dehydrogenase-like NADP-dependent oxidoreductase